MTDISSSIPPTGATAGNNSGASFEETSATQLGQDLDSFLHLLTTQLQHQDPFDPMDTAEFTNQLVQFSQVEQSINQNKKLQQILDIQTANQATLGISYIGLEAQMKGNIFDYLGGEAQIGYTLPESAVENTAHIVDPSGNVVRTLEASTGVGEHTLTWDGTDNNGLQAAPGLYRVQFGALDSEGEGIEVESTVPGLIEGFETDGNGSIYLNINGQTVPATDITAARLPGTSTNGI